jgi:hypothetical protein
MHVFVNNPLSYDGREFSRGVHEVSAVEAESLYGRGAVRPATVDEVERAEANRDRESTVETAARRPSRKASIAEPINCLRVG